MLAERLRSRGMGLAGGYLGLPFSEPDEMTAALSSLDALLDVFDAVDDGGERPKPTLADAGSAERSRYPGRAAIDRSVGLDEAGLAALRRRTRPRRRSLPQPRL